MNQRRPAAAAILLGLCSLAHAPAGCTGRGRATDPPPDASPLPPPQPAPPAAAPSSAPTPPTQLTATPRPPTATCSPFTVPPPYPDSWVEQAAASPAFDLGAWATQPMTGPFTTRDLAEHACTDRATIAPAAPFHEIIHCTTGDVKRPLGPENIARHVLLVRTARGWWAYELVREYWPHGGGPGDEARVASVTQLAAADLLGDSGAEITAIAEAGPPGGAKMRRVLVCGVGPSGVPACADIRVAAGGPFHGAGSMLYRLDLACDGGLSIAGWEGGAPVKLVHGRATLGFR